jgi:hypothetical protein
MNNVSAHAHPTPVKAFLILLTVVIVIVGFITICRGLGLVHLWAGFAFLLFWGAVEQLSTAKLVPCALGAFFGLTLGWLSHALPEWLPEAGIWLFLGILLVAIYCQIIGRLPIVVNACAMTLLTFSTIPELREHFYDAYLALLAAVIFFGGLKLVAEAIARKSKT